MRRPLAPEESVAPSVRHLLEQQQHKQFAGQMGQGNPLAAENIAGLNVSYLPSTSNVVSYSGGNLQAIMQKAG